MGKFKRANSNGKGLSHPVVKVLIVMNILILGLGWYIYNDQNNKTDEVATSVTDTVDPAEDSTASVADDSTSFQEDVADRKKTTKTSDVVYKEQTAPLVIQANNRSKTRYTVAKGQAHFHNKPDPATRRKAFINHWNKAVLQPLDEQNGFIYIVYTNHLGQTSKGWLQISELQPLPGK